MRATIVVGLVALLLSGCEDVVARRSPYTSNPPKWSVREGQAPNVSCGCPGAHQLFLWNETDSPRDVKVMQEANNVFTGYQGATERAFNIGARSSVFLACSPETVTRTCDTTYSWRIDGVLYRGQSMSPIPKSASVKKSNRLAALAAREPPLSCEEECLGDDEAGPRCFLADNTANGRDTGEHRLLASIAALGENGRASRHTLLSAWGKSETDEPCLRGEVLTTKGVLTNIGRSCVFEGMFGGVGTGVQLTLPDEVVGSYKSQRGGFVLNFPSQAAGPALRFTDPGLNRDFGGPIRQVEQTRGYFLISAGKACLGLKL